MVTQHSSGSNHGRLCIPGYAEDPDTQPGVAKLKSFVINSRPAPEAKSRRRTYSLLRLDIKMT